LMAAAQRKDNRSSFIFIGKDILILKARPRAHSSGGGEKCSFLTHSFDLQKQSFYNLLLATRYTLLGKDV
jgi:hypothetical protein